MEYKIPQPLKEEHQELHAELIRATQESGKTGEAAKAVAEILHPHFVKEEEYALPPLGLLPLLATDKIAPDMEKILALTDVLKTGLHLMLEEHKAIIAALNTLAESARKENKEKYVHFVKKLIRHAQTEEEVLYPAAILTGEYLKLKLNR